MLVLDTQCVIGTGHEGHLSLIVAQFIIGAIQSFLLLETKIEWKAVVTCGEAGAWWELPCRWRKSLSDSCVTKDNKTKSLTFLSLQKPLRKGLCEAGRVYAGSLQRRCDTRRD